MPENNIISLNTDLPLALLPVRLETRFSADGNELLVRVFPDVVHVDSFKLDLSELESTRGKHFWRETWLAGSLNDAAHRSAWAQLVELFGPQRAAWIVKILAPENSTEQPATPSSTGGLSVEPRFPELLVRETDPGPPYARALPNFWVALGYDATGKEVFRKQGRNIRNNLALFPSNSTVVNAETGKTEPLNPETLKYDPEAGWLVDFNQAEAVGMGLRIKYLLKKGEKLGRLLVLGVKASSTGDEGQVQLQDLLQAHHFTEGIAFIPQGTPSNNVADASSGYSSSDPGCLKSYEIEFGADSLSLSEGSNRLVMARALGVRDDIFAHVAEAAAMEQRDAMMTNDALWDVTWGNFLGENMALPGAPGSLNFGRDHFRRYVRARGPLPALRIAQQPYGVLPVMSLALWRPSIEGQFDMPLVEFLRKLRKSWVESLENVPRFDGQANFQQTLLRILAMTPVSINHYKRRAQRFTELSLPSGANALRSGNQASVSFAERLGLSWIPPQIRMIFATYRDNEDQQSEPNDEFFALLLGKVRDYSDGMVVSDTLVRETLDLCSHRYDAWVTSLATKRLDELRNKKRDGIYLGGYGWVEDLTRNEEKIESKGGFIHAPSLPHATTAALLRSGYMSRDKSDAFAVNLSSDRVRLATWLLEGVRQGQPLGALLGYRFERGLHENYPADLLLDQYISPFRRIAALEVPAPPTEANAEKSWMEALEVIPANNIVDGLALLSKWKLKSIPWGKGGLPADDATNPDSKRAYEACSLEIARMADAVDAIGDLVIAESVHQVAQGKPVQAGATLEAIALGEAPPPKLDVIRTPRSGIAVTHRIAVLFGEATGESAWGVQTVRAQAEPQLNAWAAQLLGPFANKATCRVEFLEPTGKKDAGIIQMPLGTKDVAIEDLALSPLDLLYLPETELAAQRSELEQRVVYHALRFPPEGCTIPDDVVVQLTFDTGVDVLSFAEILEAARAGRQLITASRALSARDLILPGEGIADDTGSPEGTLNYRAEAAVSALMTAHANLVQALPVNADTPMAPDKVEQLREAMMALANFGIAGAVPLFPTGADPKMLQPLRVQAESVKREVEERLGKIKDGMAPAERLNAIFGQDFRILPPFKVPNPEKFSNNLQSSEKLLGSDPLQAITWFQRVARVREGAARLDLSLLYAEALGGPGLELKVTQLPFEDDARWAAMTAPDRDRLSLVVVPPFEIDATQPVSGLLVDEWVEVVPSKDETTGVAFNYDAPGSRPPQAVLLAVAPDDRPQWDLECLAATVLETLELAKLRAVDLTALVDIGQFLPALYFPEEIAGAAETN